MIGDVVYGAACRAARLALPPKAGFYGVHQRRRQAFTRAGFGRLFLDADLTRPLRHTPKFLSAAMRNDFLFIHIPKNGGNIIRQRANYTITHTPAIFFRYAAPVFFEHAWKFAISRNPYDRLVSAFHFLKNSPMTENDKEWASVHLEKYDEFGAFVRALDNPAVLSAVMCRFHFMPQWYFVCDYAGNNLMNHVVKLENFSEEAIDIGIRIGMDLSDTKKVNVSKRGAWRDYYDVRSAATVRRIYGRDFEIFDYSNAL